MASRPAHPELGPEGNPLLEVLAPFSPMSELPKLLQHEPLKNIPWRALKPEDREIYLREVEHHYWPVEPQLDVCADIQLMIRAGLAARNPLSKDEQRRIAMLALAPDAHGLRLQSLRTRAGGAVVAAITGMGKSTLVERALSVFAPEQIIVHGQSKSCGWSTLTQVTYLIVDAPPNATRHGFFEAIIGALDRLLGTDYSSVLRRQRNIDAALVYMAKTLSIHRVGLLIIDENQGDSLARNQWGSEFILIFLGLMNLGIPVVLMGNPLAFTELGQGAQLTRRFASNGWHELLPATDSKAKWWRQQFAVGLTRFSLCESSLQAHVVVDASFGYDRGIPGLASALWLEANRIALRRGGEAAIMGVEDVDMAARSPRFRKLADIAKSVSEGNTNGRYTDLPITPSSSEQTSGQSTKSAPSPEDAAKARDKLAAALKSKQSRRNSKSDKDAALNRTLTEDDLRRGTDAMSILAKTQSEQGEMNV